MTTVTLVLLVIVCACLLAAIIIVSLTVNHNNNRRTDLGDRLPDLLPPKQVISLSDQIKELSNPMYGWYKGQNTPVGQLSSITHSTYQPNTFFQFVNMPAPDQYPTPTVTGKVKSKIVVYSGEWTSDNLALFTRDNMRKTRLKGWTGIGIFVEGTNLTIKTTEFVKAFKTARLEGLQTFLTWDGVAPTFLSPNFSLDTLITKYDKTIDMISPRMIDHLDPSKYRDHGNPVNVINTSKKRIVGTISNVSHYSDFINQFGNASGFIIWHTY